MKVLPVLAACLLCCEDIAESLRASGPPPAIAFSGVCPLEVAGLYTDLELSFSFRDGPSEWPAGHFWLWGLPTGADVGTLSYIDSSDGQQLVEVEVVSFGLRQVDDVGALALIAFGGPAPVPGGVRTFSEAPPSMHATVVPDDNRQPTPGLPAAGPILTEIDWLAAQPEPRFLVVDLPGWEGGPSPTLDASGEATILAALRRTRARLLVFEEQRLSDASDRWARLACGSGGGKYGRNFWPFNGTAWIARVTLGAPLPRQSGRIRGAFSLDYDYLYEIDARLPGMAEY